LKLHGLNDAASAKFLLTGNARQPMLPATARRGASRYSRDCISVRREAVR
jgi:hypothetical protein